MDKTAHAKRNIKLFVILKIFSKRVFLPLAAIYFMDAAGFTFGQIGLLGSFFYLINFLSDVPTGMFADRVGRVASLRLGAFLNICSTLIYVLFPNKPAIVLATIFEAVGYGFLLGAGEALIHDSLVVLDKVSSYTKVISRTQSVALVANAILLAFVPMTYRIDHRLPFLMGTIAYFTMFVSTFWLKDVAKATIQRVPFTKLKIVFSAKGALGFAVCYGIIGALYTGPSDMVNLAFKQLGMDPSLLGWVFSIGSITGALFGIVFHHVKRVNTAWLAILDGFFASIVFLAIYAGSLPLMIAAFIASVTVWRFRRTIYQEMMLTKFPGQPKATLLSIMSNLEGIQQIWMPFTAGVVITHFGLKPGFGLITIFAFTVSILFVRTSVKFFTGPQPETVELG